jgi:hypothetical protein
VAEGKKARTPDYVRKMPEYVEVLAAAGVATDASKDGVEVTDEASAARASEVLTRVSKAVKLIDSKRKDATAPYRNSTKVIDAEFKELASPLEGVEERLKREIGRFEGERRRQEEEAQRQHEKEVRDAQERARKQREDEERAAAEAASAGEPAPAPEPPPTPPAPPPPPREKVTRHTGAGSVGTRTVWKHEVVDFEQLPDDYKVANDAALTKAVREGERSIPGVRIYPDEVVAVR